MKGLLAVLALGGGLCVCSTKAGITIGVVFNDNPPTVTGQLLNSDGTYLTAGGISVGYFADPMPDLTYLQNLTPSNAWTGLKNSGFKDIRLFLSAGSANPADWEFSKNIPTNTRPNTSWIGGTVYLDTQLYPDLLGKQFFIAAFNAGEWDTSTNLMEEASFGGTAWAIWSNTSSASYKYFAPSINLASKVVAIRDMQISDVIVGTYVNANTLALTPEPSSLSLLVLGGVVVALCRRKRS